MPSLRYIALENGCVHVLEGRKFHQHAAGQPVLNEKGRQYGPSITIKIRPTGSLSVQPAWRAAVLASPLAFGLIGSQNIRSLDQDHPPLLVYPKLPVSAGNWTRVACFTGVNSSKELFEQLILVLLLFGVSTYVDHNLYMAIPVHVLLHINFHKDGVRRALASPHVLNHVRLTTMKRLDQDHIHPLQTCLGRKSNPGRLHHSRPLQQRAIWTAYTIAIRNLNIWRP